MRKLLLLRPEPGLSASFGKARSLGLEVVGCPLFRVEPVGWAAIYAGDYDALLLTSANALRHGGPGLDAFKALPVHAVGAATATAARAAGFGVATVGDTNVADLLAGLPSTLRLLHLAGEDHHPTGHPGIERRIVYRSTAIADPGLPDLGGMVAAVHSPRAGARLADLAPVRSRTAIAAISAAAAEACGQGWERIEIAAQPTDDSLLALAATLCHTLPEV